MISLLIIFSTIIISAQGHLMYENVTGVSLIDGMYFWVVLLICLSSFFYTYKMHWLYNQLKNKKKMAHIIINITMVTMCMGSIFPYTLNSHDLFSQLHVYLSMLSSLSFLILLFVFNRFLSYENFDLYNEVHWYYDLGIQFLGILLIVFTRVNGYLEIMFVILVTGYLYILEKAIKRHPNCIDG